MFSKLKIKSNQGNMAQSFECLLCKHSFNSVSDPKLKVASFFLFALAIVFLFVFFPVSLLLFGAIWALNQNRCPRCRSKRLLATHGKESAHIQHSEPSKNKSSSEKQKMGGLTKLVIGLGVFLTVSLGFLAWLTANTSPKPESVYKTSEADLKVVIDEEKGYDMLDVQYALARLIDDKPVSQYPFYAMKDPQGGDYFAIIELPSPSGTFTGEAIFLVSEEAFNQTKISDLEGSIRYVNGLANDFADRDINQATEYSSVDVMKLINASQ